MLLSKLSKKSIVVFIFPHFFLFFGLMETNRGGSWAAKICTAHPKLNQGIMGSCFINFLVQAYFGAVNFTAIPKDVVVYILNWFPPASHLCVLPCWRYSMGAFYPPSLENLNSVSCLAPL
jgi:hypothetical protein